MAFFSDTLSLSPDSRLPIARRFALIHDAASIAIKDSHPPPTKSATIACLLMIRSMDSRGAEITTCNSLGACW